MDSSTMSNKEKTDSNKAWHRPQSDRCRVEEELIQKSSHALQSTTDPVERLRLLCLARGASGIMGLGRAFRRMDDDGSKQLNKEEFFKGLKETGLEVNHTVPCFLTMISFTEKRVVTVYMNGDETGDLILGKFLANFETEGIVDGKVTLEEFMNYYSGISVSIDNDCYFDLFIRQAYKL